MGNWFDTKQLAAKLGLAEITLKVWRATGRGPAVHRLGSRCLYSERDVEAWLATRRQATNETPAAPTAAYNETAPVVGGRPGPWTP